MVPERQKVRTDGRQNYIPPTSSGDKNHPFKSIACGDDFNHLLKYFWYLLVLYVNFSIKCLKYVKKR